MESRYLELEEAINQITIQGCLKFSNPMKLVLERKGDTIAQHEIKPIEKGGFAKSNEVLTQDSQIVRDAQPGDTISIQGGSYIYYMKVQMFAKEDESPNKP